MRIVVDTNIVFSAILNTNSQFSRILLQPKSRCNFYSTLQLLREIHEHADKLIELSGYSSQDLERLIQLITGKIRFINPELISRQAYFLAESLTLGVDIDDTEFVALTEHLKGRLWSGDKKLQAGLTKKGWTRFITTSELLKL